jgi:hypothetical protein
LSLTTRSDTPGSGTPTVPPRRCARGRRQGLEVSITVSLMP